MNKTQGISQRKLDMIKEFQCAGCVNGSEPETCGAFCFSEGYGFCCAHHVLGTFMLGVGSFALGLPRGFCRAGFEQGPGGSLGEHRNTMNIRMWDAFDKRNEYNKFNVAVWALEKGGFLFVRVFDPRTNRTHVDVIEGGSRAALCPNAIDVSEFIDDMD